MRITIILCCALVVSSCASRQPVTWNKDGGSQQEYAKDSYACEKDMRQSGNFGPGLIGQKRADEFVKACMRAHGYDESPAR